MNCTLSFVVARDGLITDIKASGNNESFNKEAVYALSEIRKKFIPATINGEPVRYRFRIPLNITFQETAK
ncbi:energy transducer TonB [Chryseobacterium sp. Leaf180]|uniref:energy transducer TonB n=1 Tax=Chryseobacterium sp. Leaf180 TaxID=1736289 RepID=UPI0012FF4604|nr:energy transducer TonB [Chryseobacterium sp. Leaf180]